MAQPDPDVAALWAALQSDAVAFRDAAYAVVKRWQYVQLIQADLPEDLFRQFNVLSTIALIYYGRAGTDEPYDFDEELARARRGS
jgi:hypothetical protein